MVLLHCDKYLMSSFSNQDINTEEEFLGWQFTPFPQLQSLVAQKEPFEKLWTSMALFHQRHEEWLNGKLPVK